jgi:hypothetical protein
MSFRSIPLLLVLTLSGSALATDFTSPRAAGMGGAGHAAPLLNDAIYMNPSVIAMLPAYQVSASHETAKGPDNTEPKALVENVSVQDGTNSLFAAGLGYTRKTYGREVNIGAAERMFDKYGIGIGSKFLFGSDSRTNAQDATLSFVGGPVDWFQGGLIVDNLIASDKTKGWGEYREFILGTKFNIQKILLVYFDPHLVPGKPGDSFGYEAGVELPLMSDLYIRAGTNKNSFQPALGIYGDGHGFGIGWAAPRMSLDVAITKTIHPVPTNNFLFSVTIL